MIPFIHLIAGIGCFVAVCALLNDRNNNYPPYLFAGACLLVVVLT